MTWDASGFVPGAFKFAANITQAVTAVNTGATVELVGYAFTDIMPLEVAPRRYTRHVINTRFQPSLLELNAIL